MTNVTGIVTVGFFLKDSKGVIEPMIDDYTGQEAKIAFNLKEDPFIWNRPADADEGGEDGHLHWNAAIGMFYQDGVFSWEEYGPRHSEEEIRQLVARREGGVRKAVTHGHGGEAFGYFLDHHDMLLKIVDVSFA